MGPVLSRRCSVAALGGGPRAGSLALVRRLPATGVTAVDISPRMLHRLTKQSIAHGIATRTTTVEADLRRSLPGTATDRDPADGEMSVGAPGGIPQVSIDAGGQFAVDGQYGAYGSYDDIDLSADAATGTSEVSIDSAEAGVSGYGGAAGGAEFGVDLSVNPVDGLPEVGVDTGFEFDADNGFDIGGGYDHVEITQDAGGSVM